MLSAADIQRAFTGPIQPVRTTPLYRLSMAAVAVSLVLLQGIYLALIAFFATYWYWFGVPKGRLGIVVIIGPIVAFFLLKPLLARPPKPPEPLSLDPELEPALYALVNQLCDTLGAPRPARIDVDINVNASASFRRGLLSFFSRDLVLTIGLPLAATMNARQLTAVLAHEFGHFAQGAGMRFTYLIRTISYWFARVVYERDAWDDRLARWGRQGDFRLMLLLQFTRLCIWCSRKVLWVLMKCGELLSALLSRQMEFDADRHAIRAVGTVPFAETMRLLPVLDAASSGANVDLERSYADGQLGDNWPAMVAANVPQLRAEQREALVSDAMLHNPGMYASHPPLGERIAAAEQQAEAGAFHLDAPAAALFTDFEATCRAASLAAYHNWLGNEFRPEQLVDAADVVEKGKLYQQWHEARIALFGGLFDGPSLPAIDLHAWLHAPATAVDPSLTPEAVKAWHEKQHQASSIRSAAALLRAGFRIKAAEFFLEKSDQDHAEAQLAGARTSSVEAQQRALAAAEPARQRLLPLLTEPSSPVIAEALSSLRLLAPLRPPIERIEEERTEMLVLLENFENGKQNETYIDTLQAQHRAGVRTLENLGAQIGTNEALRAQLLKPLTSDDNIGEVYQAMEQAVFRYHDLCRRALGQLASSCEPPK